MVCRDFVAKEEVAEFYYALYYTTIRISMGCESAERAVMNDLLGCKTMWTYGNLLIDCVMSARGMCFISFKVSVISYYNHV